MLTSLYKIYLEHPVVITDSREISKDCLFFALKGERFNGNLYALEALAKGAAYAVVDEEIEGADERCILVADVLKTLQDLAHHHRQQLDIPVLAITGSNGKTTTKELVYEVLSNHYETHATKGNFNNHIGVPLTLLAMPLSTRIAVIEMGANHEKEIEFLCEIAAPTHGLITNIGKAHLDGFGSLEGVKRGKSELYQYLAAHNGCAFVNEDAPFLLELAATVKTQVSYKETAKDEKPSFSIPALETIMLDSSPFITSQFLDRNKGMITVKSQLIGEYNFQNIMTAICIGRYFKVPTDRIKQAIEHYRPTNNRSEIVHKGSNTILLDAYNANPTSMALAIAEFAKMPASQKIVVLGDMFELGAYATAEHCAIANQVIACGFEQVCLVGKAFGAVQSQVGAPKAEQQLHFFETTAAAKVWFVEQAFEEAHILIKGSRGVRLERLLSE